MPTEDDLRKQRDRVDKLREQLAQENAKLVAGVQDQQNEVEMAQLKAEEASLLAELAAAKDVSKKAAIKSGASLPLAQAKQQMEEAVAREKAVAEAAEEQAKKEAAAKEADQAGKDQ